MRHLNDNDRKLHDALTYWLSEEAFIHYDEPEQAQRDVLEMIDEWAAEWIADSKEEKP